MRRERRGELAVYVGAGDSRQWVLRQWAGTEDGAGRNGPGIFTFRALKLKTGKKKLMS